MIRKTIEVDGEVFVNLNYFPEGFVDEDGDEYAISYAPVFRAVNVGDRVTWELFGGTRVTANVIDVDWKNGSPIFIGDNGHWGYEDQVVR